MKINLTFDLTPEEFRKAMGLPDVQEFQQEFFNLMLEKMRNGEEGVDMLGMYQLMMKEGMDGFNKLQDVFFKSMSGSH